MAVYGHVESNPQFPAPELLLNQASDMKVKKTVFGRKFDKSSKSQLSYILFGNEKNLYMAHYLTDDENSFDQIVAVEIDDIDVVKKVSSQGATLVEIPSESNPKLVKLMNTKGLSSKNNKFKLPVSPMNQEMTFTFKEKTYSFKVKSEIYFNNNNDLKVRSERGQ